MTGMHFELAALRAICVAAPLLLAGSLSASGAAASDSATKDAAGHIKLAQKLEVEREADETDEAEQTGDEAQESQAPDDNAQDEPPAEPDTVEGEDAPEAGKPNSDTAYVPPDILRDVSALPFPARKMHELLMEAARSGDIEKLRPYIGSGEDVTLLSFGGVEGDPIDFLKSTSGDPQGHEILAILEEVLDAGFVRVEEGTPNEMYVWPYFYAVPADKLTPPQRVELFKLLTYGDYQEMVTFGAYFFYRVGITPEGRWRFFVAGD